MQSQKAVALFSKFVPAITDYTSSFLVIKYENRMKG